MAVATRTPKSSTKANKPDAILTLLARVATALGKESRKSLDETEAAHVAYVKANDKRQQVMRHAWVNAYMAAHLSVSNDRADHLRQCPRYRAKAKTVTIGGKEIRMRPRTQEEERAYDRARKLFDFHVRREDAGSQGGGGRSTAKPQIKNSVYLAIAPSVDALFAKINIPGKVLEDQARVLKAVIDRFVAEANKEAKETA